MSVMWTTSKDPSYCEFRETLAAHERDHAEKMARCWRSVAFIALAAVAILAAVVAIWQ